ncbi:MAG: Type secretion system hydrolase TadA/VirB11/CpaF, TadA subfamily [Clostridiales bacterium]|nr:Type secretion system hydrolase TadA/VirB11/CpaF, TadA subfamily [Clostridiales bacterium]
MIRRIIDLEDAGATNEISPEAWGNLRKKAQKKVMDSVPVEHLGKYRDPEAKELVKKQIMLVVENEHPGLAYHAKQNVIERLTNEISGYGPLEDYLNDPEITEIIVQRYDTVIVEKDGRLDITGLKFDSEEHLRLVIDRIVAPLGRRLDYSSPMVDARLPDGSRVNAVIPPISPKGAQLSIRKFKTGINMDQLIKYGSLTENLKKALQACVQARLSIVVSGGTGSGKSTFLNALSAYVPKNLSIITIENPIELNFDHPMVRQWEARPANIEGKGEVDVLSLVINALRARPDIIIVGEVRGPEAFALLQALNTGHDGSMSTLHANNPVDAMKRLCSMVVSAGQLAPDLVPSYVSTGIDIVVQLSRMPDGTRKLVEIAEVMGEKNGEIIINPLVRFKTDNFDGEKVTGHWERTENEFTRENILKDRGVEFAGWNP